MIEHKVMSQCISVDYCKGWNDAIEDIQEAKTTCFKEIQYMEHSLWTLIEEYGRESIVVSKSYNVLVGMKKIFRIAFGQDYTELKYFGGDNK